MGFGGAQRLITDLLPLLKKEGIDSDLLLLTQTDSPFEKELVKNGISIYHTGLKNGYSLRQIWKLAKFLKKQSGRYDLVHAHLFSAQYFLVLSSLLSKHGLPLLTTEHNTYNKRRGKAYLRWLERLIYLNYTRIICISEPARSSLVRWLPEVEANTVVVPNGINLRRFENATSYSLGELPVRLQENDKIILMVASMCRQKDQATVIKAAALLPEHYHFFFVGDGHLKNDQIKQAKGLGLSNRIHFLGVRDDVERLIKSVDLFVLSSHWEGFGLVVVEAMAGGLPVIASDVPGLADIVSGAGMLFKAGDESQLARAIEKVLTSDQLYLKLKTNGLQRAKEYSLTNTANCYKNVYCKVLETKQRAEVKGNDNE